jgi:hypothetical protein
VSGRFDPARWPPLLAEASAAAAEAPGLEEALRVLTVCAQASLGDPEAALRPGMLKEGERDYRVSGVFLISPDRRYNVLCAGVGFPSEQRRLSIPLDWANPGQVVETERELLLANTDDHEEFRQFLKTSRMGSSLYVPIVSEAGMVGQIVAAAQARHSYARADLPPLRALAAVAALVWNARGGAAWLARDYPAGDAWYADRQEPFA